MLICSKIRERLGWKSRPSTGAARTRLLNRTFRRKSGMFRGGGRGLEYRARPLQVFGG